MAKLRLALTISGAVALGAYEGGVLAALLSAIGPLCEGADPAVRLDAIGGASAGSITGLLAARCLTEGMNPVEVMKGAWVKGDSISSMLKGVQDAPLSRDALRAMARTLLDSSHLPAGSAHQELPVQITMVMACLRGLDYKIRSLMTDTAVDATTFVDLANATITHGLPLAAFLEPADASLVDIALASGANALGFPPLVLDRTADEAQYQQHGVTNFPDTKHLWYTDGGTLDNEPLGRTLDLVGTVDDDGAGDFRRLHILIHPHPTAATAGNAWANPKNPPTWLATLMRADHLQRTQSLYDDLRRVEKTNSRIGWLQQLCDSLGPALDALDGEPRDRVLEALRGSVDAMNEDRRRLGDGANVVKVSEEDAASVLLRAAVGRVAGIVDKQRVDLEVISPLILAEQEHKPVEEMLAGEVLQHFGGFFDERYRTSDFDLGYTTTLTWLRAGALVHHGLDDAQAQRATDAAEVAYKPGDTWRQLGTTSVGRVAARHPFAVAGLLAQIARVTTQDVIARHPQ